MALGLEICNVFFGVKIISDLWDIAMQIDGQTKLLLCASRSHGFAWRDTPSRHRFPAELVHQPPCGSVHFLQGFHGSWQLAVNQR